MPNLKLDLLNKLRNDKYFAEIELVRLAQDPAMSYKPKIDQMEEQLALIALLNSEMSLVEQYFQEPQDQGQGQPMPPLQGGAPIQQQPAGQVHPGQTHGE